MKKKMLAILMSFAMIILPLTACGPKKPEKVVSTVSTVEKEKTGSQTKSEKQSSTVSEKTASEKTKSKKNESEKTKSVKKESETTKKPEEQIKPTEKKKAATLEEFLKSMPGAEESITAMAKVMENEKLTIKVNVKENVMEMVLTYKMDIDDVTAEAMKNTMESTFGGQETMLKAQLKQFSEKSGITGLRYEIIVNKKDGSLLLQKTVKQD